MPAIESISRKPAAISLKVSGSCELSAKLSFQAGFTLVELIMTLVIMSILSLNVIPRFFQLNEYQEKAFFDDTLGAVRYAQKLAIATACNVQVSIVNNQYALHRPDAGDRSQCRSTDSSHFTQTVFHPGSSGQSYTGSQPGMNVSDTVIYFDALGQASNSVEIKLGRKKMTIVSDTGFVYDSSS
ncbi:type II secretion system protein [Methylicorpusculum sp.]|uniref:type II secretion system protein n=3 Tax=Methylicorpusculum sp. TaxID=2713644 RepID=UPI00273157AC|nr:type II secretion system protein [Methylicorpusculum sp.]MDP2179503.1 type II secretion system protein [Methylicorpusculum sp.]MDP3529756.1 type II secretion system protein [Methylicorpusculum sp.]